MYTSRRGQIKFGCHRTSVADTDTIFVDLELLSEVDRIQRRHFETYEGLFQINDQNKKRCLHVLVRGHAGTGKSTLVSRLSYKWATLGEDDMYQYLGRFKLVITLDVRKFRPGENLQNVIENQLLTGEKIDCITEELCNLGTKCLYLVDGFDEISQQVWENETQVLDSPLLENSFVIVTTRPHMVDRFCQRYFMKIVHVYLSGFSPRHVNEYVAKFFKMHEKSSLAKSLFDKIESVPLLKSLSTFPILLLMLCHLWLDQKCDHDLPESLTELYYEAITYLNKHWEERYKKDKDEIILQLGNVAIDSLFEGRLVFDSGNLSNECIEDACAIGLIYKEDMERHKTGISFIHKTFHEFCAAFFWSSLAANSIVEFNRFLKEVTKDNLSDMEYVLRFCCGHNITAAREIFSHVLNSVHARSHKMTGDIFMILLNEANSRYQSKDGHRFHDEFNNLQVNTCVTNLSVGDRSREILCKLSSLFILLRCTPSLLALIICRLNIGELDSRMSVVCDSLTQFDMTDCIINANTLLAILSGIPALLELTFKNVDVVGNLDIEIPGRCNKLKKFEMKNNYGEEITGQTIVALLRCMPSLQMLKLELLKIRELDSRMSVVCDSLTQFDMTDCIIDANTLLAILSGMPALLELTFKNVDVVGNLDIEIPGRCNKLKKFEMKNNYGGEITGQTIVALLRCMPSLQMLKLELLKIRELDSRMSVVCDSLTQFDMTLCTISANTLLAILSGMLALPELTFENVDVEGNPDTEIPGRCNKLKRFEMKNDDETGVLKEITGQTMVALLRCMPSLQMLKLERLKIRELDSRMSVVCESLTQFDMTDCTISANTLLAILSGMPALPELTFENVDVVGGPDIEIPGRCNKLKKFEMKNNYEKEITGQAMVALLRCMPSLQMLKLEGLEIGELDSRMSVVCDSLTQFDMTYCTISANTLLVILSGMPALPELTFEYVDVVGDPDTEISGRCNKLKKFEMKKKFRKEITGQTMVALLRCMPSLQMLKLDGLKIGDLDSRMSVVSDFLTQFHITRCAIGANALQSMVSGMPSLQFLKLSKIRTGELNSTISGVRKSFLAMLSCMPSLRVLALSDLEIGEFGSEMSIVYESLREFDMSECRTNANTLLAILSGMPLLQKLTLKKQKIGELDSGISVVWESLTQFEMTECTVDKITFFVMLIGMPSLTKVTFDDSDVEGDPCFDIYIPGNCYKHAIFTIKNECGYETNMTGQTLIASLRWMPSLTILNLTNLHIGELDSDIQVELNSLTQFNMTNCTIDANTRLAILSGMPLLQKLTLKKQKLGELDSNMSRVLQSLTELDISFCTVSAKKLQTMLSCMPALQEVTLNCVKVKGNACIEATVTYDALTTFTMVNYESKNYVKILGQVLIALLRDMPSLKDLTLEGLEIGELDSGMSVLWITLTEFQMTACIISANALLVMLSGMPSLQELILDRLKIEELNSNMPVMLETLKQFKMRRCTISAKAIVAILSGMPSLEVLTLNKLKIGDLDPDMSLVLDSLKQFSMTRCKISTSTLKTMLSGMPLLGEITLRCVKYTDGARTQRMNRDYKLTVDDIGKLRCCLPDIKKVSYFFDDLYECKAGPKSDKSETESESESEFAVA